MLTTEQTTWSIEKITGRKIERLTGATVADRQSL
jgi:hypothetical protein